MPLSSMYNTFADQRSLFRAYDIRGDRMLFSDGFVTALSTLFAEQFLTKQTIKDDTSNLEGMTYPLTIVIGYDPRHGSLEIAQQLAKTFINHNIKVVWLGLVTTPMMFYWANRYDGHGFIATASHSAKHINGIKWVIDGECPSSEDIQQLYDHLKNYGLASYDLKNYQLKNDSLNAPVTSPLCSHANNDIDLLSHPNMTTLSANQLIGDYTHSIDEAINHIALSPTPSTSSAKHDLKIVIDCLNGATGAFAKQFFEHFSADKGQVIVLNDTPNGDFPKGNPDPTESYRLTELQDAVLHHKADIGLAFDGDGDRLMVVDDQGKTLAPDHLIYLLACVAIDGVANKHHTDLVSSATSTDYPTTAATVIFDVKCSHHLPLLIKNINAVPQMSKTGSSIMRRALQNDDNQAIFAGELSGHFLFNDGFFILYDDAMYAATRLLHWLSHQLALDDIIDNASNNLTNRAPDKPTLSLSEIIAQLPHMVSTEDIYLSLDDYQVVDSDETSLLNKLTNLRQKLRFCCEPILQEDDNDPIHLHQYKDTSHTPPVQAATILQCDKFGLPKNARLTCIDGIRLDFDKGFGVIRSSNTSNSLTVRFAGDTLADIQQVKRHFVDLCKPINKKLARQIANIPVSV